jgi:hypothetical protein
MPRKNVFYGQGVGKASVLSDDLGDFDITKYSDGYPPESTRPFPPRLDVEYEDVTEAPIPAPAPVDMVNNPPHYQKGEHEPIKVLEAWLSPVEYIGGCIFNVIKYCARWRGKGKLQDLEKAEYYLKKAIEAERKYQTS